MSFHCFSVSGSSGIRYLPPLVNSGYIAVLVSPVGMRLLVHYSEVTLIVSLLILYIKYI